MTLEERAMHFHEENPHVYDRLVELARTVRDKGYKKCGIALLIEVLRWDSMLHTTGDFYKLNQNYAAYYSRMIMAQEPDLAGFFTTRTVLHSAA